MVRYVQQMHMKMQRKATRIMYRYICTIINIECEVIYIRQMLALFA